MRRRQCGGNMVKKERLLHPDILRVLAIWGVLFIHSDNYGIYYYQSAQNPVVYWLGAFIVSVAQYCVPLFFMISGGLLLQKQESLGYVLKHRVLRIGIVIAILVLVHFVTNYLKYPEYGFDITRYFQMFYEGALQTEYWFLFEYFGFLLVLPFLQRMVHAVTEPKWYIYVAVIFLFFHCMNPFLSYHLGWKYMRVEVPVFTTYIFCAVMGYFIENHSGEFFLKGRNVLLMLLPVALMVADSMHLNYIHREVTPAGYYSNYYTPFYAMFLYVLVRYFCHKWTMPGWVRSVFAYASAGVFGTYLLENWLRPWFLPVCMALRNVMHAYLAAFVWLLVCFVTGIVVTNLLKKIPGFKKLL